MDDLLDTLDLLADVISEEDMLYIYNRLLKRAINDGLDGNIKYFQQQIALTEVTIEQIRIDINILTRPV